MERDTQKTFNAGIYISLAIIFFFWTGPSVFAAQKEFTAELVVKIRTVGSAKISPDGKHVAYTLSVPRPVYTDDDGPAWSELHLVDQNGSSRPYVTGKINVKSIDWTADGKAISFIAQRNDDEHQAFYIIPLDGGEARKALEHETDIEDYTWSPDGRQIAFTAKAKLREDIEKARQHGFDAEVYEEDWRPIEVWIAKPDFDHPGPARQSSPKQEPEREPGPEQQSEPERKNDNQPRLLPLAGSASTIAWSPAGKHLALMLAPTPLVDDSFLQRHIHIIDVASGESIAQVQTEGKLDDIAWSPDGKYLAFIGAVDNHDPYPGKIMVANIDPLKPDIDPVDILADYPGHIRSIAWQDNDTIMFLGDKGVGTSFEKVGRDGKKRKIILEADRYTLGSLTLARDGMSAAFMGDSPEHPSEVWAMNHGETTPRRLSNSNSWLDDIKLAKQQVIRYQARDGLELEGILIRPLDEKAGQRYPLIMMVHGGPEAHFRNGWLTSYGYPGQVAAAQGFAVFFPNYRGSTGRGLEFSKLSQASPAGKEFEDIIDAIGHLAEMGLVDKKKVGITGISYGGYATAWAATALSEHYAAAVMGFGISDLLWSFALSDIPEELTDIHLLKYPWEDMELFRAQSPLTHFQNCRTPLLMIHGTSDTRVHPAHALALYRMLKTYGQAPVRLVLQPNEPHGSRRTGSRVDYMLRLLRWMNHYLQGPGGKEPPYELDLSEFIPKEEKKDDTR